MGPFQYIRSGNLDTISSEDFEFNNHNNIISVVIFYDGEEILRKVLACPRENCKKLKKSTTRYGQNPIFIAIKF